MNRDLGTFEIADQLNAGAGQPKPVSCLQAGKLWGAGGFVVGGLIVQIVWMLMSPSPSTPAPCPSTPAPCPACEHCPDCRATVYETLTGNKGHFLPEMYGKVKEKTIWLYWNERGTMPDFAKLCIESIEKNRGSFDVRLIYKDEILEYVSRAELPFHWERFIPAQQKDSLMNALLARYGGVAMDASIIMFEPLDALWNNMTSKGALYQGFMYRNGQSAVWCMMARRETLFRSATIAQVIGAGDATGTYAYRDNLGEGESQYYAFGDRTITPVINMYDYSTMDRGNCYSPLDTSYGTCYPPRPSKDTVGEEIGREKVILHNPTEGPQLNYCAENQSCALHTVSAHPEKWREFLERRQTGNMPFVKMFSCGGGAKKLSRSQLLAAKDSFAMHWLCEAKVPDIGCT